MSAAEDLAAIAELLARYHDGLYRCDVGLLGELFHPEAHYLTMADGGLRQLAMDDYLPIVAARRSPEATGEARRYRIEAIDLAGPDTALARMHSTMMSSHFIDFIGLLRVDGRWRIVSKLFHARPTGESPCPT